MFGFGNGVKADEAEIGKEAEATPPAVPWTQLVKFASAERGTAPLTETPNQEKTAAERERVYDEVKASLLDDDAKEMITALYVLSTASLASH